MVCPVASWRVKDVDIGEVARARRLGNGESLVGARWYVAVRGALDEFRRGLAPHEVEAQQHPARRAGGVAQSQSRQAGLACFGEAPRVKRRVEVVGPWHVGDAPCVGEERTCRVMVVADVAAPGGRGLDLGNAFDEAAGPHRLQAALAAAFREDVLAVPLIARLEVLECAHDAHRHEVEIGVRRVVVVRWRKAVAVARRCGVVWVDGAIRLVDGIVEVLVILVVLSDQIVAVRVDCEANLPGNAPCRSLWRSRDAPVAVEVRLDGKTARWHVLGNHEPAGDGLRPIAWDLGGVDGEIVFGSVWRDVHQFHVRVVERDCGEFRLRLGPELVEVGRLDSREAHLARIGSGAALEGDVGGIAVTACIGKLPVV